jgi:arylformamidase
MWKWKDAEVRRLFKKVIDISRELHSSMNVWPGDPKVRFAKTASILEDGVQVTEVSLGTHAGTHIDGPAHFIEGAAGVDQVPLDAVIGPCLVIDLTAAQGRICREVLDSCLPVDHPPRLLLKTSRSDRKDEACLDQSAAHLLIERRTKLIGTEGMSIESAEGDGSVHRALLSEGTVILEYIDLRAVAPGPYVLIALPLRLKGADGSPCRAVLGIPFDKDEACR